MQFYRGIAPPAPKCGRRLYLKTFQLPNIFRKVMRGVGGNIFFFLLYPNGIKNCSTLTLSFFKAGLLRFFTYRYKKGVRIIISQQRVQAVAAFYNGNLFKRYFYLLTLKLFI